MDSKGKSWVGNIYHKFEAICHEVDDFVSKDTVRYVENQVQSVGVSVKRLYWDVVRDILPPLGDDIKNNTQSVTGKQVDMTDNVKLITSNTTKSDCINKEHLSVEQGSSDSLNIWNTSWSSDIDLAICCKKPNSANSSPEVKPDVTPKIIDDAVAWNDSANSIEENNANATIPFTADSCSNDKVLSTPFGDDNQHNQDQWNTKLVLASSPALSVHDAELLAFIPQGSLGHSFSDTEYFSNIPRTGSLSEGESWLPQDVNFDENSSSPESPEGSIVKAHQHITPSVDHTASKKDETHCDSFSTKDGCVMVSNAAETPEIEFSYFSCDNEETEIGVISSCRSISLQSLNLLDSTCANNTQTAENLCSTHVSPNGCGFNNSCDHKCFPSSSTLSHDIMSVDTLPASSIMESNDYHASTTRASDSVLGSSEDSHTQCYKEAHSNILMSPSRIENSNICVGIGDLNMETIDLSTNVKCDVLNNNFVRTLSYRRKNFSYYKNLIRDAFASRKRLSKEYEHLPVLYADTDMDSKQHFEPSSLPSSPASLHSTRSLSSHKTSDSGWELL